MWPLKMLVLIDEDARNPDWLGRRAGGGGGGGLLSKLSGLKYQHNFT